MKSIALAALGIAAVGMTYAALQVGQQAPPRKSPVGILPAKTLEDAKKKGHEIATFGGGCFWCTEDDFRRTKGVISTEVGYSGGHTKNPTYEEVCKHTTGHVECTKLEFDPKVISYEQVVRKFFQIHDPTQGNRQGPDFGEQYRSVVFTHSDEQMKIANKVRDDVQKTLTKKITTTIEKAPIFYRAEEYHQQYFEKQGKSHGGG